jgi:hypothetical protein
LSIEVILVGHLHGKIGAGQACRRDQGQQETNSDSREHRLRLILLLCPNTIGVLFGLGELHVAGENRNWVRESLLGTSLGCVRSTATRIQSSCFPNQRDPPTRPHNLPSMAKDRPDKSSLALSRPKRQSSGLNADSNVPVYSKPMTFVRSTPLRS